MVSSVWVVFLTSVEFSSTLVLGVPTSDVDGEREREGGGGGGGEEGGGGRMGLVLRKDGLVYADFLYRFAGRRFVASIEIDADYTDADSNLQSPRMTDLVEEVCSFLFYF